jgi:hypothetical protein
MVMTRRGASSAIVTQMHGIRKKAMAKHMKADKKAHKKKSHKPYVRHHRHRSGAVKRKQIA